MRSRPLEVGAYFLDSLYSNIDSLLVSAGMHSVHFGKYHRLLSKRFPFAVWIVPLTDAWQVRREAITRRHCADQMIDACVAGACRLFSVRNEHGKSVATIGIECVEGTWSVIGFRGFANQPVAYALIGLDVHVAQRYGGFVQGDWGRGGVRDYGHAR